MDSTLHQQQDYKEIKKECLDRGVLFEDTCFSAFILENRECLLRRPKEICETPSFMPENISRCDIKQGYLRDCWFIAALSLLAEHPELLERVAPKNQNFKVDNYAGIFRFRFCQSGIWTEVVVDDRLLMEGDELKFARSIRRTDFWLALLEKAYAKFHGSYESLNDGEITQVFKELTGGAVIELRVRESENLFRIISESIKNGSLITASIIDDDNQADIETLGLINRHAYTITGAIVTTYIQASLLRIKNPLSNVIWNGSWSKESAERLIELDLEECQVGESWISEMDFKKYFTFVYICDVRQSYVSDDNYNFENNFKN
ncbi:calpain-2 catalytic subunit-like [Rhynchophorus ferrugineus]|uniref:calpain-2 catalytic subunit-like n=1 Tax=Rhynchophorus ferrugineus TaxID=354439 RepID=UPI003FCC7810